MNHKAVPVLVVLWSNVVAYAEYRYDPSTTAGVGFVA